MTRTFPLAAIATTLIASLRLHAQQPAVSDDPLTLFSRLMPVLSVEVVKP